MFEGVGMIDLRNVKLRVLSPEHSAAFQEAAFEAGVRWVGGDQEVKRTEAKYLFITDDPKPRLTWDNGSSVFEKSECEGISFTTPAYLKTRIKIRDKEHFDFVLEKLRQNGVQDTMYVKSLVVRNGDYIVTRNDGACVVVPKELISHLSGYKEIFIEKDDTELDGTATHTTDTETSDGSTASYYELPSGATELQHLISHKNMNAQIGEIFRSCYRYGQASHSNKLRDAKKIQFYINAEIERLEKLNAK